MLRPRASHASGKPRKRRAAERMFWVRTTNKTTEQVVDAVKSYVERNKWLYLSDFKLKGGEVTAVKICYPAIGKDIFAAGLHVAAMMPCGNIAVYVEGGKTTISMPHPKFMSMLAPAASMNKAVNTVTPLFESMLSEIARD
jgi:hypothetical protein